MELDNVLQQMSEVVAEDGDKIEIMDYLQGSDASKLKVSLSYRESAGKVDVKKTSVAFTTTSVSVQSNRHPSPSLFHLQS